MDLKHKTADGPLPRREVECNEADFRGTERSAVERSVAKIMLVMHRNFQQLLCLPGCSLLSGHLPFQSSSAPTVSPVHHVFHLLRFSTVQLQLSRLRSGRTLRQQLPAFDGWPRLQAAAATSIAPTPVPSKHQMRHSLSHSQEQSIVGDIHTCIVLMLYSGVGIFRIFTKNVKQRPPLPICSCGGSCINLQQSQRTLLSMSARACVIANLCVSASSSSSKAWACAVRLASSASFSEASRSATALIASRRARFCPAYSRRLSSSSCA
eukprot:349801-Chlamydomonas_euryale.AAC.38